MDINQTIYESKTGRSWEEVGRLFKLTSEAARKRSFRYRRKIGQNSSHFNSQRILTPVLPKAPNLNAQPLRETPLTVRQALEAYLGYVDAHLHVESPYPKKTTQKVVAIGDLHGDPHPAITTAVILENPDILVLGGDLYNFHQANPHEVAIVDTSQTVQAETIRLKGMFDHIERELPYTQKIVLRGNHDDWVIRKAKELLAPYPYLLPFFNDPYDVLLSELPPRWQRVANLWQYLHHGMSIEEYAQTEYMYILGDVLFSHANFTGGNEGDGVRKLKTKFVDRWRGHLAELDRIKVCVQFHGHKIAHLKPNGGSIHLIEPGMAARPSVMAYQTEYNLKWSPGALGGVVLEQELTPEGWVTQLDSVRLLNPIFSSVPVT